MSTKHQGGGYSRAFYVLPSYYLFSHDFKPIELTRTLKLQQDPWSGDYSFDLPFSPKKGEKYLLVIESNNRHPDLPWTAYANPGLGPALQGVFPVSVYSSAFGVVGVEITAPK